MRRLPVSHQYADVREAAVVSVGRQGPPDDRLARSSRPDGDAHGHRSFAGRTPKFAWQRQVPGGIRDRCAGGLEWNALHHDHRKRAYGELQRIRLDAASGSPAWTTRLDACAHGGVVLRDGKAYCGTSAGSVYCLNPSDGRIDWIWNNRDNMPIFCPLAFADELLFCGANWEMYAIDTRHAPNRVENDRDG